MANILSSITLPDNNRYDFKTLSIPFAKVDTTSTATKFTATIPGIEEYYDGLTVMLYNGKVTSASGYTININNLGAYGTYSNMTLGNSVTPTDPTRDTTIFNINYAMLFTFYTNIGGDGVSGWICYRGYDANTNTIGYQVRSNSSSLPMKSIVYRYRLLFTSADGEHFVPANNSTSTNATSSRSVCQDPIDPFGRIVYYGATASVAAGSHPSASALWELYTLTFGYSFQTSPNYSLTLWKPIYIKCAPQANGSAIIDSTTPFVQDLPSTEDGKIYIFLGVAYSTTSMELYPNHPVYYYKDGAIRLWTNATSGLTSVDWDDVENKPTFATVATSGDYDDLINKPTIPSKTSDLTNDSGFVTSSGVVSVNLNTSAEPYSLPISASGAATLDIGDGLSVSDSSGVELKHATGAGWKHIPSGGSTGQFLGYSSSGTATWQTPPSVPSAATATPLMDGNGAVGTSSKWAKEDHRHPTDTTRQATLISGTNIKTINGNSILGSGNLSISGLPSVTTSDNGKVLAVDSGAWSVQHWPVQTINRATYTLNSGEWTNNVQTINEAYIVYAYNDVIVSPTPSCISDYASAGIYCSGQADGELTFTCATEPSANIHVNVLAINSFNQISVVINNPVLAEDYDFYGIHVQQVALDGGEYSVANDLKEFDTPTVSKFINVPNTWLGIAFVFEGASVNTSNVTITANQGLTRIIDEGLFTQGSDTIGFLLTGLNAQITISGVNYSDY